MNATWNKDAKYSFLFNLISDKYKEEWFLIQLRRQFSRNDYVKLPGLFGAEMFDLLKTEFNRLEQFAVPRDLIMEGYETPRKMSALGGKRILEESPFLWMLYSHYDLRNVIRNIVGVEIYPCRHRKEFMVGNYLASSGSTHGWHLDDPAFALIVIFETPPVELGGSVELIPGWLEYCEDSGVSPEENVQPLVSRASEADLLKTKPHVSGDLYLLRADKSMHRVTGLLKDGVRRAALNLGFETTPRPEYGLTASILYEEG